MLKTIQLKKGLDIRLTGEAEKQVRKAEITEYALKPTDFIGGFPKLYVKEGDIVEAGTPIFFDKYQERIPYTSPVSGTVTNIIRGPKRVLQEIRIKSDGRQQAIDFGAADPTTMTREQVTEKMIQSGVWPVLRQRPYNIVAHPDVTPRAIYISGADTAPLAPDMALLLEGKGKDFQTGLHALTKLTEKVHLGLHRTLTTSEVLTGAQGVEITWFNGPHPAGNVGVQIHHTRPINKGEVVWHLDVQDVVIIGRLFATGRYNAERRVALTGSEVKQTGYYDLIRGAGILSLLRNNLQQDNVRVISGNALTGTRIDMHGYLGYYDHQITVLPEGNHHELVGWALPGFDKYSFSRSFFSWMQPQRRYALDTNLHGGRRALVMTGQFEEVLPMDILPMQLIKAIMIEDIDLMEQLGIYEVEPEDFALCEFVDTSKTDIQQLIRQGLEVMRKEMS